jgi:hypothetical protein
MDELLAAELRDLGGPGSFVQSDADSVKSGTSEAELVVPKSESSSSGGDIAGHFKTVTSQLSVLTEVVTKLVARDLKASQPLLVELEARRSRREEVPALVSTSAKSAERSSAKVVELPTTKSLNQD